MIKTKELFPRKIKELRAKRKISQEQLAELINVHSKSITKFENEKPTFNFDTLDKIAEALGVFPSYFFNPIDKTKNYKSNEAIALINKKLSEATDKELNKILKMIDILIN